MTLLGNHTADRRTGNFVDLPAMGTVLPNPNGPIDRHRYSGEPSRDRVDVDRTQIGYALEHAFSTGWSLRQHLRASFSDVLSAGTSLTTLSADRRLVNRLAATFDQDEVSLAVDTHVTGRVKRGRLTHTLLVGVDVFDQHVDQQFLFGGLAPLDLYAPQYGAAPVGLAPVLSFERDDLAIGAYVQSQIDVGDRWHVLLGGRVDTTKTVTDNRLSSSARDQRDNVFVPRAGLVYRITPQVSGYGSYGQAFSPNFGVARDGSTFEPETGEQYELGIKTALGDGRLMSTLAVYDLRRQQVLTPDPANPGFSLATGEQRSRGAEIELAWQILPAWALAGAFTHTDLRVTRDAVVPVGNRPRSVPASAASVWTRFDLLRRDSGGLGIGAGARYVGEREGTLPNTYTLPAYARVDAAVFFRRGPLALQLNAFNLFDKDYIASASPVGRATC